MLKTFIPAALVLAAGLAFAPSEAQAQRCHGPLSCKALRTLASPPRNWGGMSQRYERYDRYRDDYYYDPRYAELLMNRTQNGRTKREKDPQNRYQYCVVDGLELGWVPFGRPCTDFLPRGYFAGRQSSSDSVWDERLKP